MHLLVLSSPESWYYRDLVRAAEGRHELTGVGFRQIAATVGRGGVRIASGPIDLSVADAVLVRTMPAGSLEQIVFRMDALGQLEAAGVPVVNSPRAIEAAVDKYLATARLERAGLSVPRTAVCQTVDEAMRAFDSLGGDVVVKPLFGAEGRGITRIDDPAVADRTARLLIELGAVVYFQGYVAHPGYDYRLLVIGRHVLGIRRSNAGDWRTNVSRGATVNPLEVTAPLAELARRAASAVGATIAGVDVVPDRQGTLHTIEVNAVPGWRAAAKALRVDIARLVLETLEEIVADGGNGSRS